LNSEFYETYHYYQKKMKDSFITSKNSSSRCKIGPIIAIDGPAASGKSTTAHLLAKRLGYSYIDTGAMYRALTWKALKNKVDLKNEETLCLLAKETQILLRPQFDGKTRVYVDGEEASSLIRSPKVNEFVSLVSGAKRVREVMVAQQRIMGEKGKIVAEGRDIGTVVFPEAEIKIFLNASLKERVKRRWEEQRRKGLSLKKREVFTELLNRDRIDTQREYAPLRRAKGATVIDNTYLNISQTVEEILKIVKKKLSNEGNLPMV
ncbi:MAG: (d)CMP kinase, partial [Candidatus Aerophobetes bacterium]|nr:(d)CMP kinase [Candidatus Aerophobetes bacterium]